MEAELRRLCNAPVYRELAAHARRVRPPASHAHERRCRWRSSRQVSARDHRNVAGTSQDARRPDHESVASQRQRALEKRNMIEPEFAQTGYLAADEPEKRGVSMNESPVLVHVWEVDPAEEPVAVRSLKEMFGQIVQDPGFVSARVLETADQTSVAAIVEMRSVEDRQRLEQLPDVRETLHHLHGAANLVIRLYNEVGSYGD